MKRNRVAGLVPEYIFRSAKNEGVNAINQILFEYGEHAKIFKDYDLQIALPVLIPKTSDEIIEILDSSLINGADKYACDQKGSAAFDYASANNDSSLYQRKTY